MEICNRDRVVQNLLSNFLYELQQIYVFLLYIIYVIMDGFLQHFFVFIVVGLDKNLLFCNFIIKSGDEKKDI